MTDRLKKSSEQPDGKEPEFLGFSDTRLDGKLETFEFVVTDPAQEPDSNLLFHRSNRYVEHPQAISLSGRLAE
jgi:hypothetical protein